MEETEDIVLIKNVKYYEKLAVGLMKFMGYGLGSIPMWPHLMTNGFTPNSRAFSKQSHKFTENGETVYRSNFCKEKLKDEFGTVKTLNELLKLSAKRTPNAKCMGKRQYISKIEEFDKSTNKNMVKYEFGRFIWKSYIEIYKEMENISRKLIEIGIDEERRIALFASTSPEWLTTAFAAFNIGSPFITVYSTLSDEAVSYALNLANAYAILVDEKTLPRLMKFICDIPSIKYIVMSSHIEPVVPLESFFSPDYELIHISAFQTYLSGKDIRPFHPTETSQLAFIMFTSGSTGVPKGVMITHENALAVIAGITCVPEFYKPHTHAAFLPSAHIFELLIELAMISFGATIGFCTPLTLFNTSPMIKEGTLGDLPVLKPTILIMVPLFLERVKKAVLESLKVKSRFKQILFQTSYSIKRFYRKYGFDTPVIDSIVFRPLKTIFGGKVKVGVIGGSYISKNTEEFASLCFGNFKQGYGLTETASAVMVTDPKYLSSGTAGCPMAHCEIKLVPWEEGNCNPNDPDNPRGEIAIAGKCVALGYYKNEELTKSSFITDPVDGKRWFFTGDIAMITKDLNLKIIDRKKDIVKLLHGEYVSLVKIESKMSECSLTDFICVLPNKEMSYLVALLVPNRESIMKFLVKSDFAPKDADVEQLLCDKNITKKICAHVKEFCDIELSRYESPQKIYVVTEVWTPESNLITPTAKIRRAQISHKYQELLN